jgi:hypothetical protein
VADDDAVRAWLRERGAEGIPHPGGTLYAHLSRVRDRLAALGQGPDLCLAGLTHAAYGTDGFGVTLLDLDRRETLRALVGRPINRALAPYPDDLTIVTKVGPGRDPSGAWLPLARPDQLRGQVEENLRQLGRDHLDVVNLRQHGLDSVAEHFGTLADLRAEGLIRHLGLSNVRDPHLAQAQAIAPVVCVQNRYGVGFGGVNDGLLDVCAPRASPSCRSSRSPASGVRPAPTSVPSTRRSPPWPPATAPRPPRCAWRGHSIVDGTCSLSRAPATPTTWWPMSRPAPCG